ncbi:tyrosine-type recombinase/integrase [Clostridium sporogenes]|uniref:tyrosine-type recombinase/integrase n=1 Tax=Clostridium sporogenes TaxID=1509 RepID=UPI0013C82087|nr:site-specific integrase [Clostridium sporogenes]NFQ36267.1 site-specific integrase [Clostridium sporogenes]NFQ61986.1 site-specific integrase [Clostridium sporogenes]NFU11660.1 site-specific integrase [Clostridium sporogenes]NFU45231.1 site-specific integrase [Clostridium sporogenes]NFU64566.1 site-specific integrase [Clostridium sporogenes]
MGRKINCVKNGKEYYRVTVSIGRDSNGKLIRKEFYGSSKKDAENKRDEYLDNIKKGLNVDYKNIVLGELMHSWLFEILRISDEIKPSTFERYEGIYRNYIKNSDIYGLKISNLKAIQLQRYYNSLYDIGKSSNVIRNLNKLLRNFFNYAIKEGYILRNPCSGKKIVIPGEDEIQEEEIEIFSDKEISILKKALEGHRLKFLILLALGTGLRQGELLGLKWNDIDIDNKQLKVKRSIKQVNIISADETREYKTIEQSPKTKKSKRTVPIPSNLIKFLKEHKNKQIEEKLKAGPSYVDNNYVFSTELGKNIDARNLTRSYERLLKNAKIPYKKFHSLRHTYATKLFERNVPLKTVQEILGHFDISITSNIYTHVMPKEKIKAAERLNNLFI